MRIQLPRLPDPALRDTRYLASQERLVMMVRQHWIRWASAVLPVAGAAALVQFGDNPTWAAEVRDAVPGFIPATAGVLVLWWLTVGWNWRHLMITDRRLIIVSGLVWRRARSWPLGSFHRIEYTRGPIARIFGYGSITLLPNGRLWGVWLRWLPRPDRLYLTIIDMMYAGYPHRATYDDDFETTVTSADVE